MEGKVWLPWMSAGQIKHHHCFFWRKGREEAFEKKLDFCFYCMGPGGEIIFVGTQKIFSYLMSQPLAPPTSKTDNRHQTEIFPSDITSMFSLALPSVPRPIMISKIQHRSLLWVLPHPTNPLLTNFTSQQLCIIVTKTQFKKGFKLTVLT